LKNDRVIKRKNEKMLGKLKNALKIQKKNKKKLLIKFFFLYHF